MRLPAAAARAALLLLPLLALLTHHMRCLLLAIFRPKYPAGRWITMAGRPYASTVTNQRCYARQAPPGMSRLAGAAAAAVPPASAAGSGPAASQELQRCMAAAKHSR